MFTSTLKSHFRLIVVLVAIAFIIAVGIRIAFLNATAFSLPEVQAYEMEECINLTGHS